MKHLKRFYRIGMKHVKEYKLFENYNLTTWNEIKDIISVVEDEFDFDFKELKVTNDSSYRGDKIISFIFSGREWVAPLYKKDEDIYRWFIQQIVGINQFVYKHDRLVEVIKLRDDFRVSYAYYFRHNYKIVFPELTDVIIYEKGTTYEYHFNFKANVFPVLDWVIKNPEDKDLLKEIDPNIFIKDIFQYYCKRSYYDIDFNILSVFFNIPNKLITPVKKREIQLPYNLSDQFIIDITPIFLEKVFKASGLIFRLQISKYSEGQVTNPDRLRGYSIAEETDRKLKELGINMNWKDIFIIENQ